MTVHRLLALCGVALVAAGCGSDTNGTTTPTDDVAYVRYVNAIPDTSGVDFRFVDQLENSPVFPNVTYRQYTPYQATAVGARRIKIFMNPTPYRADSSQIVARQFLKDTTVTFASKTYYTIVHAGFAKTGATPTQGFYVIQDEMPANAAGKIFLRTINALFGFGSADVFATTETATTPFAGTALETNVPVLGTAAAVTPYRTLDKRPTTPTTATYKLWLRKAGVAAPAAADSASASAPAFLAQSGGTAADAVAGTQVDSTVFTALLLPASRPCSCGTRTTFATPGILFLVDRVGRKP